MDEEDKPLEGDLIVISPGPGRDCKYSPECNEKARKLALLGLTDAQMAGVFEIAESTFYGWKRQFPAFSEAIKAGKAIADAEVADSLYKQATGHHVLVDKERKNKQTGEYEQVKVSTYIPGNPQAAVFWLKNRKADAWRDKQDHEHTGRIVLSHEQALDELE